MVDSEFTTLANREVNSLNAQVSNLQSQVSNLRGFQNVTYQNINIQQNGTSLTDIYQGVRNSVVLIQGDTSSGTVQGIRFCLQFCRINCCFN